MRRRAGNAARGQWKDFCLSFPNLAFMNTGSQGTHPSNSADRDPPTARLAAATVGAMQAAWDRLGLLMAASLTWALLLSAAVSLERWLPRDVGAPAHFVASAMIPIVMTLPTAGVFGLAHRMAAHEEAAYLYLWSDGAALFRPAAALMLLQTTVGSALVFAGGFYLTMPIWAGRVGATICGYALLLWAMMTVYQWPILIAQERGLFDRESHIARRGVLAAVRRSFYLALGRPFFSVALVGILLALAVLMAATIVLSALIGIGLTSLLCTYATRALLTQFGVLPAPAIVDAVPDEQFRLNLNSSRSSGDAETRDR